MRAGPDEGSERGEIMSKLRCVCLSLLLCFPALAGAGQTSAPAASAEQPMTATGADTPQSLIRLDVVVTNKLGEPVAGLEPKDFTLLDNGGPARILSFQAFNRTTAKPDPPVEVILVIDTVNLSSMKASRVENQVEEFLRRNGGRLAQPVSIYRLGITGLSATPQASLDGNALADEVAHRSDLPLVWPVSGDVYQDSSAAIRPAVRNHLSLEALGSIVLAERRKPGRKLVVWTSFGWPPSEDSFYWITEFSTRMREARIALYSVSTQQNPIGETTYEDFLQGIRSDTKAAGSYLAETLALQVLAIHSGGRVLPPAEDLASQIDQCVRDASAYYTIAFGPPRAQQPDEYHDLAVRVDKPGLAARTGSGYYDQPSYYDQPWLPAQRLTVEQLERMLEASQHSSDGELAGQLSTLELTERMSGAKLSQWTARMPGAKSRAALVAVADSSAFLAPPAEGIPATPPPDLATQRLIMARTIDYLRNTIPRLPNFFATRTTVRYREPPQHDGQTWKTAPGDQFLRQTGSSNATVFYRNGYDAVDPKTVKGDKAKKEEGVLNTTGTFGPILGTVIRDAASGDLTWSRWEQDANGPKAVFRYVVPEKMSHYQLTFCCHTDMDGMSVFQRLAGYHGEIVIDPASGAILHITVQADLEPGLLLLRSDILVAYGPVEIGGGTYICPVRSVTISRGRTLKQVHEWNGILKTYGPFETLLNDGVFAKYRMFRGEARVLSGFDPEAEGPPENPDSSSAPAAPPKPQP